VTLAVDGMLRTLDGFCGAGGITTGLSLALEELLGEEALQDRVDHVAINHWDVAIETHRRNHPWARHMNRDLEFVKPHEAAPEGHVHLACWAPECTFHSVASGGKPTKDQKRMQPWLILPFLQELYVENVLIENVPEFRNWGPLDEDGHRIREKGGETFEAFIQAIKSLGYAVDWKVLNAADYGDPTTRRRLFIVARRNHRPVFPEPTHSPADTEDGLPDWRSASEVIDWSDPGESIWTRGLGDSGKRPLVQNTMQRIAEGIRRYAHRSLEPFADAVAQLDKPDVKQLQKTAVPVDDVTPELVEHAEDPFLVTFDADRPALLPPFVLGQQGGSRPRSVDDPAMTIATGGAISKLEPEVFFIPQCSGGRPRDADEPLPTILTRGMIRKIEANPFVLPRNGRHRGIHSNPPYRPDEEPLHTVTASNHDGHLITPYLVPFYGERADQAPRTHDLDDPMPTVPASKSPAGPARPYLVQFNGQSTSQPVDEPLPTVTTRDRFALVVPELWPWGLDIRFRMLKQRELARAMGFPDSYEFCGTKTDTTRQIGNAVAVNTAKALCETLLTDESAPLVEPQPAPGAEDMEFPPEVEA